MSKAVKEEINKLFDAVKDLHSREEIQPHCEAFNEFIKSKKYSEKSLGTVLSRCGLYSKFHSITLEQGKNADSVPKHDKNKNVTGHELKHFALLICGLDNQEWRDRNLTNRVTNRINKDGQKIDVQSYFDATGKLLESSNPHELAVGLIAATGRRPHEILARAKFSVIPDKDYWVMFEGQGKKRGENPIFPIASLFPAAYIVEKLQKLRDLTKYFVKEIESEFPDDISAQNRGIDNKRGQSLRRVVKEFFGEKYDAKPLLEIREGDDQNNCKSLRAAYLCLATERDSSHSSLGSQMLHAAKLAGHFIDSESVNDSELRHLLTTLGYLDYSTDKPVPFAPIPTIKEEIKEDETMKTATRKTAATTNTKVAVNRKTLDLINNICKEETAASGVKVTQTQVIESWVEKIKTLETVTTQLTEATAKINQLEAKIKELETVETKQETVIQETVIQETAVQEAVVQETSKIDSLETRIKGLEELILKALQPAAPVEVATVVEVAAPVEVATVVEVAAPVEVAAVVEVAAPATVEDDLVKLEKVDTARERNLNATFVDMANWALWKQKKSGVVEEKINRCFAEMIKYNDNAEQSDRIAVTSIALSQLARANRQEVSKWIETNKECVMAHNKKHGMHSSKNPNDVVTYYNKGKKITTDKAIEAIKIALKLEEPVEASKVE